MEKNERGSKNKNGIKKEQIIRIAVGVIVIIALFMLIKGVFFKKKNDDIKLEGYMRLVDVTDGKFTFINLDGNSKKYEGYNSMNDFYYDVTSVSKYDEKAGITQVALINKNEKTVIDYGTYNNYTQIVGGKYYKVEKDGKYGVVNYKGKVIINPEYNYISISTVQEATEVVFDCEKDNMYYIINDAGKVIFETNNPLHNISYSNKFNKEYDTIIDISVEGVKKYFNLRTGEELFADKEGVNFSYNILKEEGRITFYDKAGKVKSEVDTSNDYLSDARVYFRKYVVVEQKNVTSGNREYKYTVYNDEFKKILTDSNKITPVETHDGEVYFIINDETGVRIINEKNKTKKIEGYEFNSNNIKDLQYLVLNKIGDNSSYDIFTFKGKKAFEGFSEYIQKGCGLLLGRYESDGSYTRKLVMADSKEIDLGMNDNVIVNENYITIENNDEQKVSVVSFDGKIVIDKVDGIKIFQTKNYIGIQNAEVANIYSIKTGKITFTYNMIDYQGRDELVSVIETNKGYFGFGGKTILEK